MNANGPNFKPSKMRKCYDKTCRLCKEPFRTEGVEEDVCAVCRGNRPAITLRRTRKINYTKEWNKRLKK